MNKPLVMGMVTLSLLLVSCASQPAAQPESQASAATTSVPLASKEAVTPTPSSPATQTAALVVPENLKFYKTDSEEFQTIADIQKSVEFQVDDMPKQIDSISAAIHNMETAANYLVSEKTIRAALNKPSGILTPEEYMLVYEEYLKAHDVMFSVKSGDFYETLRTACRDTAYNRLISVVEGDAVPYAVEFTLHNNDTELRLTDNSVQNSVDDNAMDWLGNYRLLSSGGADISSENGKWLVSGRMELLRKAE